MSPILSGAADGRFLHLIIRKRRLGIPGDARESFTLLERSSLISAELSGRLQRMIGFRNVAMHQYQDLNLDIVGSVIRDGLDGLAGGIRRDSGRGNFRGNANC